MSYFCLSNNTWRWESTKVSKRIFWAGCDPFPELKAEPPAGVRGIPWQPRLQTQTQLCFQVFHRRRSPLLHLGRGEALFPSCTSHSVAQLLTSPLVNNSVNTQLIYSWGGERPIQFIPHIKGLKCSTVIWERRLLAQSICQEDHTCYQINASHMEDRRSGTTSKQTRRSVWKLW